MSAFVPLADLCSKITKGTTPNAKDGGFADRGVNYIKSESLSYDGSIDVTKFAFISEETNQRLKRSIIQDGDILYSIAGANLGKCGIARLEHLPANTNQAVAIIRVDERRASSRFVSLCLRNPSFVQSVLGGVAQSAQPNVNLADIGRFKIPNLTLPEQRAIAATLGALDDKIELNRKMNATLEAMARALFRDWFVDFGPTRAKMEARAPYLSPNLWSLFPTRLDDEGKPEGWEVSPLDALAEVTMGISPDGSTYNDDGQGTPLCNGPVEYGDFFLRQIKWTTAPSKLAQRGDLIICVRGSTTGRHAFADAEYCLGRGVASIRGKHDCQEFVETAILSQMNRLLEKTTGSVFPSLSTQDIKKFGLVDPGLSLRQAFCNAVRPMRAKIWAKVEESSTLGQIRDLLLPRLMSGELRVAEGERLVGEVA
ncbi:type I restriction system specificity protein [Gemmobacter nanjingensis]|uniref:Type I restriction system specificity protein n=1 Tax=Gemmobacter nanjingensis TaxID=488454 RepID=A0ABQ3FRX6_9RHOB|nr:restriction endonuclease subunit S [Gemmobacter nanjingensis]GHC36603.1 type I restriction system specificity protein [Gemmobacter nanjingensis]